MTISSTVNRNEYPGSGSTGPFAYSFRIFAATDLRVIKRSSAGVETVLTNVTHYTVAGVGAATGTVTLVTALAVGETLVIKRVRPVTQTTSIRNEGDYFPATIEDALDHHTMVDQQQQEQIDRSIKLDESYDPSAIDLRVPAGTAGQVLGWASASQLTNLTVGTAAGVTLPGQGRTVATLSAYLANNAVFNVMDFGATGNGATDDTAAIALCLANAPTGSVIIFPRPSAYYRITARLAVANANVTIIGQWGTEIRQITALTEVFYVTASGVRIGRLKLTGPGGSTSARNGAVVRFTGTVGTYLADLEVADCDISLGNYGVLTEFCERVRVQNNRVSSCYYGGIFGEQTQDALITHNIVDTISGSPNAYGISATRTAGVSLAVAPRSTRWLIQGNTVANVPNWEAIDTHAGTRIDAFDNYIYNCAYGIAFGSDSDNNAPQSCRAKGNYIAAGTAVSSAGILISGNATNKALNCLAEDNHVDGHGTGGSDVGGSIRVQDATDAGVRGNEITNWIAGAISLEGTTSNADVGYNRIRGGTAAGAFTGAIKIAAGQTVTGSIHHNDLDLGTLAAIRAAATQEVFQYSNRINTTGYHVLNPGYFRARSTVPGVQLASTGTTFTPDLDKYEKFVVTATGNITIAAPTGRAQVGMEIEFVILQDATGGRTVGWNATYLQNWSDAGNTAGLRSRVRFLCVADGGPWLIANQSAYR